MTNTKTKVSGVHDIEITQESITASGTVNTLGWTNAELILRPSSSFGRSEFDVTLFTIHSAVIDSAVIDSRQL